MTIDERRMERREAEQRRQDDESGEEMREWLSRGDRTRRRDERVAEQRMQDEEKR